MAGKATGEIQEDNARTRVTLWSFPPHGETGFHRHELDYVIVPLTTGPLTIVDKQGKESTAELTAGVSYFRQAGVEHNVINAGAGRFAFVEVEFKQTS
jgi:beta-alanine degradation protein BauB